MFSASLLIDPEFAKAQLRMITSATCQHPYGQLPAYEWNFGDANPPLVSWAAWQVYMLDLGRSGVPDRAFLEAMYRTSALVAGWWFNRKDTSGNSVFGGGFLVGRLGRRPLLLISLGGMATSLVALAAAFFMRGDLSGKGGDMLGIITIVSLMVYVASFAIGLGPVFWLLIAEIYPLNVRGPAMSLAAVANWGANWLVAATFLSLINMLSAGGTFLLFAVVSVGAWFFVQRLVFETKGKTLEQIELQFAAEEHIALPSARPSSS